MTDRPATRRPVLVLIAALLCLLGAVVANGDWLAGTDPLVFIGGGLALYMAAAL